MPIPVTNNEAVAIAASSKNVDWLFDVIANDAANNVEYFWSAKTIETSVAAGITKVRLDEPKVIGGGGHFPERTVYYELLTEYREEISHTFKVIQFEGIDVRETGNHSGIVAPGDVTFTVDNDDGGLTASDFEGGEVGISLRVNDYIVRKWAFRIHRATGYNKKIVFHCESFINQYLYGTFPNYPLIKDLFLDDAPVNDSDTSCIPWCFGTGYLPIKPSWVDASSDIYYTIYPYGEPAGVDYITVMEMQSPVEVAGTSIWKAVAGGGSQAVNKANLATDLGTTITAIRPFLLDSDDDGTNDSVGAWKSGEHYLSMPVKYYTNEKSASQSPANIIYRTISAGFGVNAYTVDIDSFVNAGVTHAAWGLEWDGGYWRREQREKILTEQLIMAHSTLVVTDAISLYPKLKTSQADIDDSVVIRTGLVDEGSFIRTAELRDKREDGGYILYADSDTPLSKPQVIGVATTGVDSPLNPTSERANMLFIKDNQMAQKLGQLYFQRKLEAGEKLQFRTNSTLLHIIPGDVVRINDTRYGGTYNVVVNSTKINKDLSMEFTCSRYDVALTDPGDNAIPIRTIPVIGKPADRMVQSMISTGPNSDVDTGDDPNELLGKLRMSSTTDYIELDPVTTGASPALRLYDAGTEVVRVGNLNDYGIIAAVDTWGIESYVDANNYFSIDSTNGFQLSTDISGGIIIRGGGDIWLEDNSVAVNPSEIRFVVDGDNTKYWTMLKTVSAPAGLYIRPSAALAPDDPTLYIGGKGGDATAPTEIHHAVQADGKHQFNVGATTNGDFEFKITEDTCIVSGANDSNLRIWDASDETIGRVVFSPNYVTPADDVECGWIQWLGLTNLSSGDDGDEIIRITGIITDSTFNDSTGKITIQVRRDDVLREAFTIAMGDVSGAVDPEMVFNEAGIDIDIRFEASGVDPAFYIQGSDGNVGFNTSSPDEMVHMTSSVSGEPVWKVENTNADALGAGLQFWKKLNGSAADNDRLGYVDFWGLDSGDNDTLYAYFQGVSADVTNGDEAGELSIYVKMDNLNKELLTIDGYNGSVGEGEVIINKSGADVDFIVEAVGINPAFMVEGSSGVVFINDSVNTFMAGPGITINQSTNDDEILTLKSTTDVAHRFTNTTEADSFSVFTKVGGSGGGLHIEGFMDASLSATLPALKLTGYLDTTNNANGAIYIEGIRSNGATPAVNTSIDDDNPLIMIANNASILSRFFGDGSFAAQCATHETALAIQTGDGSGVAQAGITHDGGFAVHLKNAETSSLSYGTVVQANVGSTDNAVMVNDGYDVAQVVGHCIGAVATTGGIGASSSGLVAMVGRVKVKLELNTSADSGAWVRPSSDPGYVWVGPTSGIASDKEHFWEIGHGLETLAASTGEQLLTIAMHFN